jgi:hypothetical protein
MQFYMVSELRGLEFKTTLSPRLGLREPHIRVSVEA